MSNTKTVVVELAKLGGTLAATAAHGLLNALVPSPAERRARSVGQVNVQIRPDTDGLRRDLQQWVPDEIWAAAVARSTTDSSIDSEKYSPDGVHGSLAAAQEVPGASPLTAEPSNNLRGCGREPRIPDVPSSCRLPFAGVSGRTSDGRASCVQPSTRTPHDEIVEPVGEYPDVDPRAVITGARRDWSGMGGAGTAVTPPASSRGKLSVGSVLPKSSAGHSPFPVDTAPSPAPTPQPGADSGPQTPNSLEQPADAGVTGPGTGPAAPFTFGDLAEAARIVRCWAELTCGPTDRARIQALADRLDKDAHPDPNP